MKEWKPAQLLPAIDAAAKGRNWTNGRQAFVDAQCVACHKMGNQGGGVGPDLTAVSSRFTRRDMLESLLEPSKVVSEQFMNTTFTLKDDEELTGRIVDETGDLVVIYVNPFTQDRTEIKKSDIKSRTAAKLSPITRLAKRRDRAGRPRGARHDRSNALRSSRLSTSGGTRWRGV